MKFTYLSIGSFLYFSPVFLFLFFFSSCQSRWSLPDEQMMAELMKTNPDSVAVLLENMILPADLTDQEKVDYAWWLANTHTSQGRSLINDTLILFAAQYYEKTRSPRVYSSYRWAARQANWSGKYPDKEEALLNKAVGLAIERKDTAQLAESYYSQTRFYNRYNRFEDAIVAATKLKDISSGGLLQHAVFTLALDYSILEVQDSALKYISLGLDLARREPLYIDSEYHLTRMYAEYLNINGHSRKALQCLREISRQAKDPQFAFIINLNYAFTWINIGETDSASVYINRISSTLAGIPLSVESADLDPLAFMADALNLMVRVKSGKPVSLNRIGSTADRVINKNRERISIEREQMFARNKLAQDNLTLQIEKGKLRQRVLWAGVAALMVLVLFIYFYQRKLLRKEKALSRADAQARHYLLQISNNETTIQNNKKLIESLSLQLENSEDLKETIQGHEDEIELLKKENDQLQQENAGLQDGIRKYSDTAHGKGQDILSYERLVEKNAMLQERERFLTSQLIGHIEALNRLRVHPRYIDDAQWVEIIHAVNLLYDQFIHRLSVDFPQLTEEDLRYCCLVKLQLSTSVIAILTAISPSSVTKRKQRIKDKMSQQKPVDINKSQPLELYLWNY